MNLVEIGLGCMDWSHLAVVGFCENCTELSASMTCSEILE
jgi:hypothetical protein